MTCRSVTLRGILVAVTSPLTVDGSAVDEVGHPAGPPRAPGQPLPRAERERFAATLTRAGVLR